MGKAIAAVGANETAPTVENVRSARRASTRRLDTVDLLPWGDR
jgi:hypothetical protein